MAPTKAIARYAVTTLSLLTNRHLVAILLKDLRDGGPTGAIGESTMYQNDVLDGGLRCGLRRGRLQSPSRQRSGEYGYNVKIPHGIPPFAVSMNRLEFDGPKRLGK